MRARAMILALAFAVGWTCTAEGELRHGQAAQRLGPLGEQAQLLTQKWTTKNSQARSASPLPLAVGQEIPLLLSPELLDPGTPDCASLAVFGVQESSFLLTFPNPTATLKNPTWPVPSSAGIAEVTACGADKARLAALHVKSRSKRTVLQLVTAHSPSPLTSSRQILRGRDPGLPLPPAQLGPRPQLAPLKERLSRRRQSLKRADAPLLTQTTLQSGAAGTVSRQLRLAKGCHRIDLLSNSPTAASIDLDAELYVKGADHPVEQDSGGSGDATLMHCSGRESDVRLEVNGGPPQSEIVLLQASWPLFEGVPMHWGPRVRAQLSRAARDSGLSQLPAKLREPVHGSMGVRGRTIVHVPLEADACYWVLVAPFQGRSDQLALHARFGPQQSSNQSVERGRGTALSLCASGEESARIEVRASGTGMAWLLGMWRASPPTEKPRQ